METESIKKDKSVLFYIGLFVFSGLLSFTASYLYEKTFEEILRNVLVNLMTTGTVIFMLNDIDPEDTFLYGNIHRKIIFVLIFMGEMTMAAVMPSINFDAWPYMVLFVILALFSNPFIGVFSGASLVMFSELLSVDTSYYEFFIYFVAGSIAIALFRDLTEETKIGLPLFISMLMQLILLLAFHVLFLNSSLTPSIVIVPVVNVFINMILLTILLNFVGVFFIRKSNDMYMDINDTEFKLLVDIKDKNKDEYFRAIHTAYLAERAAMDIGINARVVKTLSYYGRANKVFGTETYKDTEHYFLESKFPVEVLPYLNEYIEPDKKTVRSKEYTVTAICDSVISSITYIIHKTNNIKINYDEVIDKVFAHKMESRELYNTDMSLYELERVKKLLKKEKLYYDFLR